jgi:hypothetical protein
MFTLLFALLAAALTGVALWSSQRGEGTAVVGGGNAFDAYYGKKKEAAPVKPCLDCEKLGCIGAGECRCLCHHNLRVTQGISA